MNVLRKFSLARLVAMLVKEFTQMRRDKLTFGMMLGIPLMQLILFGFVINADPKHLATAVLLADQGPQGRTMLSAIRNSGYFDFVKVLQTEMEAEEALARGEVQFVVNIPAAFSRDLLRGDRPAILVEADATDPAATGNALGALRVLVRDALQHDLKGPLAALAGVDGPIELRIHPRYNPEAITQYNIIPGLMGVILTMTMIMITGLAITRERERGTMENLLSMPTRPLEVLAGKIIPYILVGYIQVGVILVAGYFLFGVPITGNVPLLFLAAFVFIVANLAMGITFSTIARNQLQAMQMAFFVFLPSILLSGFMFPFRGMPVWAQYLGEILPITHFLRIVRGIMLKGNGYAEVIHDLWPIALFGLVALVIAVKRYRRTLD
ncbi:MAG: ABC transporter permease [Verrucomicrobiae bacterium]|nr:ABC transporter permease [Verrucomicrobiae bacterium]